LIDSLAPAADGAPVERTGVGTEPGTGAGTEPGTNDGSGTGTGTQGGIDELLGGGDQGASLDPRSMPGSNEAGMDPSVVQTSAADVADGNDLTAKVAGTDTTATARGSKSGFNLGALVGGLFGWARATRGSSGKADSGESTRPRGQRDGLPALDRDSLAKLAERKKSKRSMRWEAGKLKGEGRNEEARKQGQKSLFSTISPFKKD